MNMQGIESWIALLTFGSVVLGFLARVFTVQIKMKQTVANNHQRHNATDKIVEDLKQSHHEVVRRQDVTESRLTDQKDLMNKIDSKIDELLKRGR